jgi:hypothetical protein
VATVPPTTADIVVEEMRLIFLPTRRPIFSTRCSGTAKATAAVSELTHAALMLWLITQLHGCRNQFLSLRPNIKVLSFVLELEVQSQRCNSRETSISQNSIRANCPQ